MIMPLDELLQRLVNVTPGKKSFLSVYLDLSPDRSGKKLHTVFLKSRLPELTNLLPARSPERSLLAKDIKRVQKYLEENLDPAWKGIALFACASDDLFVPIPMPLPPENALGLAPYPHLFPLIRQADLYKTHAVVVADSRQARLFLVCLGRLEKQLTLSWQDKHTTRFGRMGWSLDRFRRHLQEHIKQRAKEIVENLEKLINSGKTQYLFAAAEEGMEAELKKQLPTAVRKNLIPLPSFEPHDPDHKILSAAFKALQTISSKKAEALARHILEEAEPLGRATSGPEPTLSALQNHQMERMVLDARFKATGWRCPKCSSLGTGGSPSTCPFCQGEICPADLREEIVAKAKSQGVELFFTENFSPLMKAGGIAGLLKYKTPIRTKR
jgi:peptide subunit release factor 1 (eRF1)